MSALCLKRNKKIKQEYGEGSMNEKLNIVDERISELIQLGEATQQQVGARVVSYLEKVVEPFNKSAKQMFPNFEKLKDHSYSRDEVFEFINDQKNDELTCAFLIFAWGGMSYKNARLVLSSPKPMIENIELIRADAIDRDNAYHGFYTCNQAKIVKGLGPAFYTKLLYYFGKKNGWKAYIMDQWTALSINYLFDRGVVKMNKVKKKYELGYAVSGHNDYQVYDKFNNALEQLSHELSQLVENKNFTPEEAEIMIFSEGRGKGAWRTHLLQRLRQIEI
jgi:hypothetical protein